MCVLGFGNHARNTKVSSHESKGMEFWKSHVIQCLLLASHIRVQLFWVWNVKIVWVGNVSMGFWISQVIQNSQVMSRRVWSFGYTWYNVPFWHFTTQSSWNVKIVWVGNVSMGFLKSQVIQKSKVMSQRVWSFGYHTWYNVSFWHPTSGSSCSGLEMWK